MFHLSRSIWREYHTLRLTSPADLAAPALLADLLVGGAVEGGALLRPLAVAVEAPVGALAGGARRRPVRRPVRDRHAEPTALRCK